MRLIDADKFVLALMDASLSSVDSDESPGLTNGVSYKELMEEADM